LAHARHLTHTHASPHHTALSPCPFVNTHFIERTRAPLRVYRRAAPQHHLSCCITLHVALPAGLLRRSGIAPHLTRPSQRQHTASRQRRSGPSSGRGKQLCCLFALLASTFAPRTHRLARRVHNSLHGRVWQRASRARIITCNMTHSSPIILYAQRHISTCALACPSHVRTLINAAWDALACAGAPAALADTAAPLLACWFTSLHAGCGVSPLLACLTPAPLFS